VYITEVGLVAVRLSAKEKEVSAGATTQSKSGPRRTRCVDGKGWKGWGNCGGYLRWFGQRGWEKGKKKTRTERRKDKQDKKKSPQNLSLKEVGQGQVKEGSTGAKKDHGRASYHQNSNHEK